MGAYLDKPVKEKEQESGDNDAIFFALTSMQGWRTNQEDAHSCVIDFMDGCSLFAVYDGHGGCDVSKYLSLNFPNFLKSNLSLNEDIAEELKRIFIQFDATLASDSVVEMLNELKGEDEQDTQETIVMEESSEVNIEKAAKKRDLMIKEAIALSKESKMNLGTIVEEYARYRCIMQKKLTLKRTSDDSNASPVCFKKPRSIAKTTQADSTVEEHPKPQQNGNSIDNQFLSKSDIADNENVDQFINKNDDVEQLKKGGKLNSDSENGTNLVSTTNGISPKTLDQEKKAKEDLIQDDISSTSHMDTDNPSPLKTNGMISLEQEETQSTLPIGSDPGHSNKISEEIHQSSSSGAKIDVDDSSSTDEDDNDYTPEGELSEGEEEDASYELSEDEEAEDAFQAIDDEEQEEISEVLSGESKAGCDSGSTACLVLLYPNDRVVVANVGDSRAVLSKGGKAIDLSTDHKPEDLLEMQRITKAGGTVSSDGRVNGGLNLSRAFGDHFYKQNADLPLPEQMITALPDVMVVKLSGDEEFIVIACDGIWNSMNSQEVVNYVNEQLATTAANKSLNEIGAELCEKCCAPDTLGDGTGCDNMTVIIIDLKKKSTKSKGHLVSDENNEGIANSN